MKNLILGLLKNNHYHHNNKDLSSGFTLSEVLIATIMSSIVITSLLTFMIDIIRTNAAETARKNTLQEMRMALEFITDDLKEAVYVYTGDDFNNRDIEDVSNDGLLDVIDASDNLEPILVFWKLEDVPYDPNNDSLPNDDSNCGQECQELRISQRTYTLVAYVQDNDPTDTWEGESMIYRYQLRKYEDASTLTEETSYEEADPVQDSSFANWPYNTEGDSPSLPSGYSNPPTDESDNPQIDRQVSTALVDFVDVPNNSDIADENVGCPAGYIRTPNNPSTSNSFYACVEDTSGQKTVIVNLRGNPNGRVSFELDDGFTPLPTLNSSAILRGGR